MFQLKIPHDGQKDHKTTQTMNSRLSSTQGHFFKKSSILKSQIRNSQPQNFNLIVVATS